MKTEDLIDHIARLPASAPFSAGRIYGYAVAAILFCTAVFLSKVGTRPDLAGAFLSPFVAAKTVIPLSLFLITLRASILTARPGCDPRPVLVWIALPLGLSILLWLRAFLTLPGDQRFADVGAFSLSECVGLITLLSVLPSATMIAVLREGASLRPLQSSILAGLAAGSGAATGYSLFCVQDNPLFFVTWYGFAILLVATLTATFATRFLRW